MRKANFWFPFRCAVPGKEEQYQIFLPPVPGVWLSLQRSIAHHHGNRRRNTIWLSTEDPLNKAAQRFWLPTTQAVAPRLLLEPKLPWNTWTRWPQHSTPFQHSTCSLKMTKSNKKHFGSPFEEKTIPPPKAAATDGEGRARGAWLPAGVWAKFMLGQLGWLRGSSTSQRPDESVLGHRFQSSFTPFLSSLPDTNSYCHFFHHFPSAFQKFHHRT